MANVKITQLEADTNPASTDVLPFVDVSSDETKKVTIADLLENAGSGSANAPAFAFDDDPDTGMYRAGAKTLAFATNGGGRLFISSTGNVGFGTSTPAAAAHLRADGNDLKSLLFVQNRNGGANAGVQISLSGALNDLSENRLAYIRGLNTGASQNGNHLTFGTNPNGGPPVERLRIASSGNVGISETSPQDRLHIKGNASSTSLRVTTDRSGATYGNSCIVFDSPRNNSSDGGHHDGRGMISCLGDSSSANGTVWLSAASASLDPDESDTDLKANQCGLRLESNGSLELWASDNNRFAIDSSGKVGINTTSIDGQLEVRSDNSLGIISRSTSTQSTNSNKAYRARNNSATDTFNVSYKGQGYFADSLGIGTAGPNEKLDVSGTGDVKAAIQTTTTGSNANVALRLKTGEYNWLLQTGGAVSGGLRFYDSTNSAERVRIDSSGRLLVGTSSYYSAGDTNTPSNLVYVENTGFNYQSFVGIANRSDIFGSVIVLGKTRGTAVGSNTIVQDDDQLGIIRFVGADGVDRSPVGGAIECQVDGTPGSNDMPGRLVLSTTADGAATPTERMRISNNGELRLNTGGANVDVGSGTTDGVTFYHPSNSAAGAIQTSTNGGPAMYLRRRASDGTIIDFRRDTTSVGTISVTTTATAYNTSSDYRLKENVVDIADGITRVKQLQPRRFNFIADAETTVDGFLAHEAQTVVPEAVTGEKDGEEMQGIDQSKLVPLLTAALQEAIAKIETLEQRLTDGGL